MHYADKRKIGSKNFLICNRLLSLAIVSYGFFNQESWTILFESLQRISYLIYKAKYDNTSITPAAFHLSIIDERVLDSLRKIPTKPNLQTENADSSMIDSPPKMELLAGTGEQDYNSTLIVETFEEVKNSYEVNPFNQTDLPESLTKISDAASIRCNSISYSLAMEMDNNSDTIPSSFIPRVKIKDLQAKVSIEIQTLMSLVESLFTLTKTFSVIEYNL